MKKILSSSFLPKTGLLLFRGLGILSKFLLTFLITKKISLEFQGSFSLISTAVTLLVLLFGFDFYIYSNKLLIKNSSNAVFYLKNNLVFYLGIYAIIIPVFYFVFINTLINTAFNFWLLVFLVVLEHLGQEFFRSYIALQRVYFANVLLFIRSGIWPFFIVLYLYFTKEKDINLTIDELLLVWAVSAFITVIFSFVFYPDIKHFFKAKVDFNWIKKGLFIAGQMFLATIFLKIVEFSDRYIIDYYYDKETVGIYTFYAQLANLANVIIFTLFISFIYPKIIEGVYKKNKTSVKKAQKEIKQKSFLVVLLLTISYIVVLPLFLNFVGRPQLYEYQFLLFGLLLSSLILNISYAAHYTLIGKNQEKKILKITFISFLLSISLNFILIKSVGIWGALIAQLVANSALFLLKEREIRN